MSVASNASGSRRTGGDRTYAERRSAILPATVWVARRTSQAATDVLPDGCVDLIWDGASLRIAGPDTRPHRDAAPGTSCAALRFDPGAGPGIMGVTAAELRNRRIALDEVWSTRQVRRWRDALCDRSDASVVLETLVADSCSERAAPSWVAPAAALLRSGAGIGETARAVFLSERELRRRSSAVFGYGPKTLQRILRVADATAAVAAGAGLSEAAARHGYADCSHLHRESRVILGRSPVTFRPGRGTGQPAVGSGA